MGNKSGGTGTGKRKGTGRKKARKQQKKRGSGGPDSKGGHASSRKFPSAKVLCPVQNPLPFPKRGRHQHAWGGTRPAMSPLNKDRSTRGKGSWWGHELRKKCTYKGGKTSNSAEGVCCPFNGWLGEGRKGTPTRPSGCLL